LIANLIANFKRLTKGKGWGYFLLGLCVYACVYFSRFHMRETHERDLNRARYLQYGVAWRSTGQMRRSTGMLDGSGDSRITIVTH